MTFSGKTTLALAISSILLSGCFEPANESGDPIAPGDPNIETPGRSDLAIEVTAPSDFYTAQTLTEYEGSSLVDLFLSSGFSFDDLTDVEQYFLTEAGDQVEYNMQLGELMVAQAYNPDRDLYFSGMIGYYNPDEVTPPSFFGIDPVTEALYSLVSSLESGKDAENGLTDEYQSFALGSLLYKIGQKKLILEGLTPEQADNADSSVVVEALDRTFVEFSSANTNYENFIYHFIDQTTWSNTDGSISLVFDFDSVTYTDSSNETYNGTYSVTYQSSTELNLSFESLTDETISLASDSEGSYVNFLSTKLYSDRSLNQ